MTITSLPQIREVKHARRMVVKVGSALLVEKNGQPRRDWLASLVAELAELRASGQEIIIVSSGAVALGAIRLGFADGGRATLADAQAAASVGQVALASLWAELLSRHDLTAAQLLLTLEDLEDRRRYLNVSATLARLIEAGAIPVINENDSVATHEIRFGDNDRLAARVAQAAQADAVVLLSDVDGLYEGDPRANDAQLVEQVDGVTPDIMALATQGSASGMGSGGMMAKLQAAQIAEKAGIALAIINGTHNAPIGRACEQSRGTVFLAQRQDGARKAWLGGRIAPAGTLIVDAGCARALSEGNSLLAPGIAQVTGHFARGDLVLVETMQGERLGQGLSEYSAVECRYIAGLSQEHQARVLGYVPRSAVIHRNHWVAS